MNSLEVLLADEQPDIVSIVEHWCSVDNLRVMYIPGYVQSASFCWPSCEHGGVVIYIEPQIQAIDIGISELSEEMKFEFSAVKLTIGGVKMRVVSAYRPPSVCCPTRYIKHKGDSSKSWISNEIKQAGQELKKLHWLKTNLKTISFQEFTKE
ncbi:hypothetical protein HHI36_021076, partial [Cryptolaemus montrouzieri]